MLLSLALLFFLSTAKGDNLFSCGFTRDQHLINKPLPLRNNFRCPQELRVLRMGVAADCEYVRKKGGRDPAIKSILSTWSEVSALFREHFNVIIKVIDVRVFEECDDKLLGMEWNNACKPSYQMLDRLSDFSRWRAGMGNDAGLWHLMTGCPSSPTAGLSWGGMVCSGDRLTLTADNRWVAGAGVSSLDGRDETQVVAHEVAHNFGASHDCHDGCTCSGSNCVDCCSCQGQPKFDFEQVSGAAYRFARSSILALTKAMTEFNDCNCKGHFLMSPTTSMLSTEVSECTKREVCNALAIYGDCLRSYEVELLEEAMGKSKAVTLGQCGNGVIDPGEECDCGKDCAKDPCCDEKCRLRPRAVCSDKNHACCQGCQLVPGDINLVCRGMKSECDVAETCDGIHPDCPIDVHKPDGTPCSGAGRTCASGYCTNRDEQCRDLARRFGATMHCKAYGLGPDDKECRMQCMTPAMGCVPMNEVYINGTECSHGRCYDGRCVSAKLQAVWNILGKLFTTPFVWVFVPLTLMALIIVIFSLKICLLTAAKSK